MNLINIKPRVRVEGIITKPTRGTCVCGEEVRLAKDFGHGINCGGCYRIYNLSGQELNLRPSGNTATTKVVLRPYKVEFERMGDDYYSDSA